MSTEIKNQKGDWKKSLLTCLSLGFVAFALSTQRQSPTLVFTPIQEQMVRAIPTQAEESVNTQEAVQSENQSLISLDEVQKWQDFARWKTSQVTHDFLAQLASDEFSSLFPFLTLNELGPLKKILQEGVLTFNREVYRSPEFSDGAGYDTVKYEILHRDGKKSQIYAYRQKTSPDQLHIGSKEDLRPIFTLFVIESKTQENLVETHLFENGTLKRSEVTESQKALSSLDVWLQLSTRILASI